MNRLQAVGDWMTPPERTLFAIALILAPAFFALSTFFWVDEGEYGVTSATLLIFGSIFWIVVFTGLFGWLREVTPRYAAWGLLFAIYGCVCGGVAFAFIGFFMDVYGISHESMIQGLDAHPVVSNLIFWIGGPAFSLSLLILGIVLIRTKNAPIWLGAMLSLAGALFPFGRAVRVPAVAHVTDLLMLIPLWCLAAEILRTKPEKSGLLSKN